MSKTETIDEALDRIIKQEFGDGFGNLVNSVDESIDNFGKSIFFPCMKIIIESLYWSK